MSSRHPSVTSTTSAPRACRILGSVDLIAAEDTRRTRGLLSKFSVKTPTISYHDHNEASRSAVLLKRLRGGESVALVSDAGTPLLSDPGLLLVRAAHEAGVPVVSVPGPSALTAALSVAGEPAARFVFQGFLPRRAGPRRARMKSLARESGTVLVVRIGAPDPRDPGRVAGAVRFPIGLPASYANSPSSMRACTAGRWGHSRSSLAARFP